MPKIRVENKKKISFKPLHYSIFLITLVLSFWGTYFLNDFNWSKLLEGDVIRDDILGVTAPNMLSFQGRLTNRSDTPITAPTNVTFKIYNAPSGGTALWTGSCTITPDQDGIFDTLLGGTCGSSIPTSIFSTYVDTYLGITVGTDSEMIPRQKIVSSAYALNADTLDGFDSSQTPGMNNVVVLDSTGNLTFGTTSPVISSSGNLILSPMGNVGINISNPTSLLHVNGDLRAEKFLDYTNVNYYLDPAADGTSMVVAGNVGIGTTSPATKLHIAGDGSILAQGTYGTGWDGGSLGAGSRLMWIPSKSAFRAGYVDGTQWNTANIGDYSVAMGHGTTASASYSIAMGYNTIASGDPSVAMGYNSTASGYYSTAMGFDTTASGPYSTAMGTQTTASGFHSTAMGYSTTAQAYGSTVIGRYNVISGNSINWTATDPIFVIGVGSNASNRANAMTVLKNGNVGIGATNPTRLLQLGQAGKAGTLGIAGSTSGLVTLQTAAAAGTWTMTLPTSAGSNGQVLTTNGSGVTSWTSPSSSVKWNAIGNPDGHQVLTMNANNSTWNFTTGALRITNNSTEALYVGGGNVGIGTTAPATKLHIDGDGGILAQGTYGSGWDGGSLGTGSRLMWIPSRGAFRAGYVNGDYWDAANIGNYSVAMGYGTTANAPFSTAMGESTAANEWSSTAMGAYTIARGDYSTAMGYGTTSSGNASTAMGGNTSASGNMSTAMGENTTASGDSSTAMGGWTIAGGNFSTAMGAETTASGWGSTGMGVETTASGFASTAMGGGTTASGNSSTAMGFNTTAQAYASTVLGQFNVISGNTTTWTAIDPVFVIGIGSTDSNRANAMTVLKNGNVGIGPTSPVTKLHIDGDGSILAQGTFGSGWDGGSLTFGSRLMWIPSKAAFRAGAAVYDEWDASKIGSYSVATGHYTTASGDYSTAMGRGTIASGESSTAMGYATTASGFYSTAMGVSTTANENYSVAMGYGSTASGYGSTAMGYLTTAEYLSTAMGYNTTASGNFSTAMGYYTTAQAYGSTVIGRYNVVSGNTTTWTATDPIFVIGIGSGTSNRANAMTVLKNGRVGIGVTAPTTLLQVGQSGTAGTLGIAGSTSGLVTLQTAAAAGTWTMTLPTGTGTNGQVLTTNGSGVTSWTTVSGGGGGSLWSQSGSNIYYNGGNVGIGTNSPQATLHVNGNVFVESANNRTWGINNLASGHTVYFQFGGDANNRIENTYGSNTTFRSYHGTVFANYQGNIVRFGTASNSLNTNFFGNVGIAATSPTRLLQLGQSGTAGTLGIAGSSSGLVTLQTAAAAGTWTMTLPTNTGSNGQVLTTNGSGVTSWTTVSGGSGGSLWSQSGSNIYFSTTSTGNVGIGTSSPLTRLHIANDGGILAQGTSGSGWDGGSLGAGSRLMWIPSKGAFRAGAVDNDEWNASNIGAFSVAMGADVTARGRVSIAMGNVTTASGDYSTAMGAFTQASGEGSTAMGAYTVASGDTSTAMGNETTASGGNSTAMGGFTQAHGNNSTAMGYATTASGDSSIAMGQYAIAQAYASTVIGRYNVISGNSTTWIATDPVFVIGIGTNANHANAMTVLKNGNVGIGPTSPVTKLHIDGDGGILAQGATSTGWDGGSLGAGSRLMWIPRKAAFRAGYIYDTQWDASNIGDYSVAMGFGTTASGGMSTAMGINTIASGSYSTAMGNQTTASGDYSTAMGYSTTASEWASTAMGGSTTASGIYSTAMGRETTASGENSTAMGYSTTAQAYASTVLGRYNVILGTTYSWVATDPVFVIGIGSGTSARANAMTVLKNGRVGIGVTAPTTLLQVGQSGTAGTLGIAGSTSGLVTLQTAAAAGTWTMTLPTNTGSNGQVLTTNGSGVTSWTTVSGGGGGSLWSQSGNNIYYSTTSTGNVGIGTSSPLTRLHIANNGGILAESTQGSGWDGGSLDSGTRLMWIPSKSAFRAGYVNSTQWNTANIGNYSVAMGQSTTASGNTSTAMGYGTTASGIYSTAMGGGTTASGVYSTAMGINTTASGDSSTAMGYNTTAQAYASAVIGRYNVISGNTTTWTATDPIFVIGIGSGTSNRVNAITVLKNGRVGIGVTAPTTLLQLGQSGTAGTLGIAGSTSGLVTLQTAAAAGTWTMTLPTGTGTNGQVLTTNGSGVTSWTTVSGGGGGSLWSQSGSNIYYNGGNVGIGTNSPQATLHVNGNVFVESANNRTWGINNLASGHTVYFQFGGDANNRIENTYGSNTTFRSYHGTVFANYQGNIVRFGTASNSLNTNFFGNVGIRAATNPTTLLQLGQSGTAGTLGIAGSTSGLVTIRTAAAAGTWTMTLPTNTGSNGQVLTTNGSGVTSWTTPSGSPSDERLKNIAGEYSRGLTELLTLNPILFSWNELSGMEMEKTHAGFSAQNVQRAIPEAVELDQRGYLSLNDRPILAATVNAIKEQQEMISTLNSSMSILSGIRLNSTSSIGENIRFNVESKTLQFTNDGEVWYEFAEKQSMMLLTSRVENLETKMANINTTNSSNTANILKVTLNKEGNIELLGGNILMEGDGTLSIKKLKMEEEYSIGSAKLTANQLSITINTKGVTKDSKVFVNPTSDTYNKVLYVTDLKEGKSFRVNINEIIDKDITFDWFIIDSKKSTEEVIEIIEDVKP